MKNVIRRITNIYRRWPIQPEQRTLKFWYYCIKAQAHEVREAIEAGDDAHAIEEIADVVLVGVDALNRLGHNPTKVILARLEKNKKKDLSARSMNYYKKLAIKGSDPGPPMTVPNPNRPETLPEFVTEYCRARIKDVEEDDGLSPETKHMLKMKYLRILNDAADILNKMKVGQKKDFDLAQKMQELAGRLDTADQATKTAQTASLRTKRRMPKR